MGREGRLQGCCSSRHGFGSLVWRSNGHLSELTLPPPLPLSSTPNFSPLTTVEKETLEDLRQWARDYGFFPVAAGVASSTTSSSFTSAPAPLTTELTPLSRLSSPGFVNLACQVIDVCIVNPGQCALLRVWDSTQPSLPLWEMNLEAEINRGPVHRFYPVYDIVKHHLVDVVLWDNHLSALTGQGEGGDGDHEEDLVRPGSYVLLKNLHVTRHRVYDPSDRRPATHELNLRTGTRFGRTIILLKDGNPVTEELKGRLSDALTVLRPSSSSAATMAETMSGTGVGGSSFDALADLATGSHLSSQQFMSRLADGGGGAVAAAATSSGAASGSVGRSGNTRTRDHSFTCSAVDENVIRRMEEEEEKENRRQAAAMVMPSAVSAATSAQAPGSGSTGDNAAATVTTMPPPLIRR